MHWSRWYMHFSSLSLNTVRLLTLYYGKLSQASVAAAQIKNDFSFHSQNVPSGIYTLGIQGRSLYCLTWKSWHEISTPFLSGPPMLQFCVGFAWNTSQEISFSCCLEEEVEDGFRVDVVLVQITKKPLSEFVIVLNFNTAVDTQGQSLWGNQNNVLHTTVTTW